MTVTLETDCGSPHTGFASPTRASDDSFLGRQTLPSTMTISRHSETATTFGERGVAILPFLLPAFKAEVSTWMRLELQRYSLAKTVDALTQPIALLDQSGRLVHRNAPLNAMLSLDPQSDRIETTVRTMARSVVRTMCASHHSSDDLGARLPERLDIATAVHRYAVQATCIGMPIEQATVMVLIERRSPTPLSDEELTIRYGLTSRERQVARLLAAGRTDTALATELGISWHTGRRHVERVLLKLGVHARTGVAEKLIGS